MKIKSLKWRDNRANIPFELYYYISPIYDMIRGTHKPLGYKLSLIYPNWEYCEPDSKKFKTIEEAKIAAQADYEKRIMNALDLENEDQTA